MNEAVAYSIGELADLAGITPRTIRYYTAEGLLPRPDARSQYALYSNDHLLRLRLIARLKEAYLPLGEIRARIEHLDTEQVRQLLAESPSPPAAPAAPVPASAAAYVAQLLNRQTSPQMLAETTARYTLASEPPAPAESLPPASRYGFAPPAAPSPEPVAAGSVSPGGRLLKRLGVGRQPTRAPQPDPPEAQAEQWRRITLAPGVELHIREPAAPALRERIERLITQATHLLAGHDD
jgi:DNA-binding transcriptional MerR regulator